MKSLFRPRVSELKRIFTDIPVLDTDRLILRKISVTDAADMYEYSKNPNVTRYLTWSPHEDEEYTRRYIKYLQGQYMSGEFYDWGLELKENGKMIGTCGFTSINERDRSAEVGYVINESYWHKGYATEALKKVIAFGFDHMLLKRIEAKHIEGNDMSASVMKKCGMKLDGILRDSMYIKGEYKTIHVYSIIREEYLYNDIR
ncbi:MAG: GNAT family N-acetyltransferase [Oscillospiraceae bacterium]|nr:GNAT family N-acetyltransferase [Oscillospiraceae bacterium]